MDIKHGRGHIMASIIWERDIHGLIRRRSHSEGVLGNKLMVALTLWPHNNKIAFKKDISNGHRAWKRSMVIIIIKIGIYITKVMTPPSK